MKKKNLLLAFISFILTSLIYIGCTKSEFGNSPIPDPSTCNNGIKDGDETDVDCGGLHCNQCPGTCNDGVKNQGETDIDCGGPCPACAPSSMTCDVDGANWTAGAPKIVNASGLWGFNGAQSSNSTTILLNLPASYTPGTVGPYALDAASVYSEGATTFNVLGSLVINAWDTGKRSASGTFDFTASTGGTTRTITNGKFSNLKY